MQELVDTARLLVESMMAAREIRKAETEVEPKPEAKK